MILFTEMMREIDIEPLITSIPSYNDMSLFEDLVYAILLFEVPFDQCASDCRTFVGRIDDWKESFVRGFELVMNDILVGVGYSDIRIIQMQRMSVRHVDCYLTFVKLINISAGFWSMSNSSSRNLRIKPFSGVLSSDSYLRSTPSNPHRNTLLPSLYVIGFSDRQTSRSTHPYHRCLKMFQCANNYRLPRSTDAAGY